MKKGRFTEQQIVSALKKQEAGIVVKDLARPAPKNYTAKPFIKTHEILIHISLQAFWQSGKLFTSRYFGDKKMFSLLRWSHTTKKPLIVPFIKMYYLNNQIINIQR